MNMFQSLAVLSVCLVTLSAAYRIEVLKGPREFELGEGPHWDEDKQELIFVDIHPGKVWRYIPATGDFISVTIDGNVSPVLPIAGSPTSFLIGVDHDFVLMEWDGVSPSPTNLTTVDFVTEGPTTRINDGKCDPTGRLIAGTYDSSGGTAGNLYRFDSDGTLTLIQPEISVSNGLAWSADNLVMYYIDSPTGHVEAFDYDIETGSISNRRSIFYLPDHGIDVGTPDGMTIDINGHLWVAVFGGSSVLHINPTTGDLLETIDFSAYASQITSVAFGGRNLDVLYVTSAALDVPEEAFAGSFFAVHDTGARGFSAGVPFVQNF